MEETNISAEEQTTDVETSPLRTIVMNNLWTVVLHIATSSAFFVVTIMLLLPWLGSFLVYTVASVVSVVVGFLVAAALYVFFARGLLRPAESGNVLSVVFLPVLLIAAWFAVASFEVDFAVWTNAPSLFAVTPVYAALTAAEPYDAWQPPVIASLLPSLFMYVGLLLGALRQKREEQ